MALVIDACVAVEYLLKTPVGMQLASMLEAEALVAPELLDAEVLAVLRREVALGRVGAMRAEQALGDLRDWDVDRISHRDLLDEAWALRHNLTAYDALYVAVARLHGAAVITADGPLSRAPLTGVVVQNVRG